MKYFSDDTPLPSIDPEERAAEFMKHVDFVETVVDGKVVKIPRWNPKPTDLPHPGITPS